MIGYPLDSHVTYKTDGTPVWDRAISSAPLRKLISSLFSDGVLPNPSTNLQVSAGTGMKVNLFAGFAICKGCQKLQESNMTLDIATASAVYDRIDTVVLRLNDNDDVRECEFYVLTGTPATTPVRPELTRSDSIWEIGLADVLIKANSTQVSNANITDTRYESARCGMISSISEFDTTTLYQQIQGDLDDFKIITQADILEWFDGIKGQLSGDVAVNLASQIQDLKNEVGTLTELETQEKRSLVKAINEVNAKEVSVLDSMEEIEANTESGKAAGALAVSELNSSTKEILKWNLLTSVTGRTEITLPNTFNDLFVEVQISPSRYVRYIYNIPFVSLSESYTEYRIGAAYDVNNLCEVEILVSKSKCMLQEFRNCGSSIADNAVITIYYR